MRFEKLCVLDRITLNSGERLRPIRDASCVAEIDETFVWQTLVQSAIDRKSADAAVKDANGKVAIQLA